MQTRHVPRIDSRYWSAIIFASIFGTNLGDFYAHGSGLGLGLGLVVLAALFAATYFAETKDGAAHETYYWLAIVIIRTGATNIADYLAFRLRIPALPLALALAALIGVLAWYGWVRRARAARDPADAPLTNTDLTYWSAMLAAGVFGTVTGDICSHNFGQGLSSIVLGGAFIVLLGIAGSRAATLVALYWCTVALARTAGTCIGDWFAENRTLHIGLPLSTLLTGAAFVAILAIVGSARRSARVGV